MNVILESTAKAATRIFAPIFNLTVIAEIMDDRERELMLLELADDFRRLGAPELADQEAYTEDTADGRYRPEPRKRLMLMLLALDRMIALEDRSTFDEARNRIREVTGEAPVAVRILPIPDETKGFRDPIAFELPNLGDIRSDLARLIDAVSRDDGTSDPEDMDDIL